MKTKKVVFLTLIEAIIAYNHSVLFLSVVLDLVLVVMIRRSLLRSFLIIRISLITSFSSFF
jgi:hypothetical protein